MKLKNKVAIITGGTRGIGYGIAHEFIREGAKVVITGRDYQNGKTSEEKLKQLCGDVHYIQCDVAKIDQSQMIIEKTVNRYGRLDIYVANAGITDTSKTHYLDITPEQYDKIMDVNLRGVFFGGQFAARQMKKQGDGGVIINLSSVNAHLSLDSQMVYTTSKGGIQQLTKVQAVALAQHNIKVNAMAPGPIETEMMRGIGSDEQLMNTILSRTPLGRIGTPGECGRLAVFLASEDSNFIFGQSIYIDGGRGFQAYPTQGYKTVTDKEYNIIQSQKNE